MLKLKEPKLFVEPHLVPILTRISQFFQQHGTKSYLVGGYVRDMLLGRGTADIDIAVAADALNIGPELAAATGGRYIPLDEVNRVCRVVVPEDEQLKARLEVDVSTLRGGIEQDLAERDFTIDAMAIDLDEIAAGRAFQIIDPFGGRSDLERKIVRVVSPGAFISDPARLLRAVRLAAELGFRIESATESLIKESSRLAARVPGERIREELVRLLNVSGAGLVPYLDELGLLTAVIPELEEMRGVEQPKEHFWNVFDHSINAVAAVDFVLRQGDWPVLEGSGLDKGEVQAAVPWSPELEQYFKQPVSHGSDRRVLLKLAALLHDIAKPRMKMVEETGRVRFFGHAPEGAGVAVQILDRLRFSTRETALIGLMVKHHMRPAQMSQDGLPSQRAIYRYFRDTGDAGIGTLFLSLADHLATRGPTLDMEGWREHTRIIEFTLKTYFEKESVKAPPKLIDGHDLMRIFGLKPGPRLGELLEAVREAQAAGELVTREDAISYIRKRLEQDK